MSTPTQSPRLLYIDNLRVFCIVLVVTMHAAVTYSGLGRWYYNELHGPLTPSSLVFFGLFQGHLQAFFMSLFFLIAGYFVPGALQRKGPRAFAVDRLKRLGIPLLVFIFLIHPVTVRLIHPELNLASYWLSGFTRFEFLEWTGPLWFAEALLVFSLACIPFASRLTVSDKPPAAPLTAGPLLLLVGAITAGAFVLRYFAPIGTAFFNLQFCYFSAYVASFLVGLAAGRTRGFERVPASSAKHWLIAAFAIGLPLWFLAILAGGAASGSLNINGGFNWGTLLFALWESFFCVAILVALLGLARAHFDFQRPWMRFLADNTFAVYVFHTPVLVGVSLSLRQLALPPVPKFFLVTALATSASFAFAWAVRKVPLFRRVFA